MMLSMIEEPVTLQLLRDLFTIFYEPLVRVYKSANVYSSVTDFAVFVDDMIQVFIRFVLIDSPTNVHLYRLLIDAGNKISRQTLIKLYKHS